MNKIKVTRNDLKGDVFKVDYQGVELLKSKGYQAIGYNSGVYGWNYDVYSVNGSWVLHGYRVPLKIVKFDLSSI